MAQAIIEIEIDWVESDGDCSRCMACGEMIFGKMHVLVTGYLGKMTQSDVKVCESCYNATQ